jgi:5-methylcytosine-specific restriction endonuclease McrA
LNRFNTEIYFGYKSFKWKNNAKNNAGVSCTIIGLRSISKSNKYYIEEENMWNNLEFMLTFFAVLAIGVELAILITRHEAKVNAKVIASSSKIQALMELNQTTKFHQVRSWFEVYKHYDNKSHFNKIEPAYLMTAEIKNNIGFFSAYATHVRENRNEAILYNNKVQEILLHDYSLNYMELKVSEKAYKRIEKKLFSKKVIFPVTDCTFSVTMSYSSPQGRVRLSKRDVFNFDELFSCLESVSRTRLDKATSSILTTVERGDVSDSLRYDILNRDNFTCVICGASSRHGAMLHVDHIIPISKGGKSVASNLRTLCERCNIGKSDKIESASSEETVSKDILVCEKCGAKLVLRKGKYGEFYGCSNYPSCKFTRKL